MKSEAKEKKKVQRRNKIKTYSMSPSERRGINFAVQLPGLWDVFTPPQKKINKKVSLEIAHTRLSSLT